MRLLVVIASYGEKNLAFLRRLIATYQAMTMSVDVVVVSEAPKNLPFDISVVVGLPSKNPWSLPFAHKRVFVENLDRYDLFIYSEDDIGVTEGNIRAFLRATDVLREDEIAGFMRYEKDAAGTVWMPDVHGVFHWEADSAVDRRGQVFARFTNEHAAFHIVTQAQLRRALASGGFVREPYEGKYDMLCAAATDPYTSCGFRKMVCISNVDDFMVHHMSNRYAGQMGLPLTSFREQLETLNEILRGVHPATTLCEVESKLTLAKWSKSSYEEPSETVLTMVPPNAKSLLSVGCGWGATEAKLSQRGVAVTALPLNSVIGAVAAKRGVKTVYGSLDECFGELTGKSYDCVLVSNLLHLQREPEDLLTRCMELTAEGGTILTDSPNFDRIKTYLKRAFRLGDFKKLQTFDESGVSVVGPGRLARWVTKAGFSATQVRWCNHSFSSVTGLRRLPLRLGRLTANNWLFRATRTSKAST